MCRPTEWTTERYLALTIDVLHAQQQFHLSYNKACEFLATQDRWCEFTASTLQRRVKSKDNPVGFLK